MLNFQQCLINFVEERVAGKICQYFILMDLLAENLFFMWLPFAHFTLEVVNTVFDFGFGENCVTFQNFNSEIQQSAVNLDLCFGFYHQTINEQNSV